MKSFSAAVAAATVFLSASAVVSLTSEPARSAHGVATWELRGTLVPSALAAPPAVRPLAEPARRTIAADDPFVGDAKAEPDR